MPKLIKSDEVRWVLFVVENEGQCPTPYFYFDKKERNWHFKRFFETGEFTYRNMFEEFTIKPISMYKAHISRSAHFVSKDWR